MMCAVTQPTGSRDYRLSIIYKTREDWKVRGHPLYLRGVRTLKGQRVGHIRRLGGENVKRTSYGFTSVKKEQLDGDYN